MPFTTSWAVPAVLRGVLKEYVESAFGSEFASVGSPDEGDDDSDNGEAQHTAFPPLLWYCSGFTTMYTEVCRGQH